MLGNIFVLEHDSPKRDSVETLVRSLGFDPQTFRSAGDVFRGSDGGPEAGCLIADFDDPFEPGIQLLGSIRDRKPCLAVILVSAQADTQRTVQAMRMGAFSVLQRPLDSRQFGDEINLALEQSQARSVSQERVNGIRQRLARLNADEQHVLQLLMDGKPNKVMANQLGVSTRTIENRRRQLYAKMGTVCVPELVRMVVEVDLRECEISG